MRLSLAQRLILGTGSILLLAIAVLTFLIFDRTHAYLTEIGHQRSQADAEILARGARDGLAARDFELLDSMVQAAHGNEDIAFALITDTRGTILASTRPDWIGRQADAVLSKLNESFAGRPVRMARAEARIEDILLGHAIVGYYTDATPFDRRLYLLIGLTFLGALIFLMTAIAALVRIQTRPLEHLAREFGGLSLDSLPKQGDLPPLPENGAREILALHREFHELVERLRKAHEAMQAEEDRLAEAVHLRTRELEAINRELESFSYSVSHDLRAPLRSIDGFSQALLEDHAAHLDEEGRDYLQRIRKASQRMGGLIDALLRLSRLSRTALQPEPVDLSALAREILEQLAATEPGRQVDWAVQDGLTCVCDPEMMRIALENLLGNAWKYTQERQPARIRVYGERRDGFLEVCVEDNGVGFDMRHADKLFGAFQRLHGKEFEGSGVGLATVQRILHRHGGHIRAEAEPERGARFCFSLPEAGPGGSPLAAVPDRD